MAGAVSARPAPPRFRSFSPVSGSRLLLAARGIPGRGERDCAATAKRLPALPRVVPAGRARLSGCASSASRPALTARRFSPQCAVQVKLELGHRAQVRKKPTVEGFTHDWMVFVRGPEHSNIQHFVEKVVFHLHESFPRPKRGEAVLGNGCRRAQNKSGGAAGRPSPCAESRDPAAVLEPPPAGPRPGHLRPRGTGASGTRPARCSRGPGRLRTPLRRGRSGARPCRPGPSLAPRRRPGPAAPGADENLRSGERVRLPGPCGRCGGLLSPDPIR